MRRMPIICMTAGKGGELLGTKKNKDEDGDDEQLWCAERPEACEDVGDIHG